MLSNKIQTSQFLYGATCVTNKGKPEVKLWKGRGSQSETNPRAYTRNQRNKKLVAQFHTPLEATNLHIRITV